MMLRNVNLLGYNNVIVMILTKSVSDTVGDKVIVPQRGLHPDPWNLLPYMTKRVLQL